MTCIVFVFARAIKIDVAAPVAAGEDTKFSTLVHFDIRDECDAGVLRRDKNRRFSGRSTGE